MPCVPCRLRAVLCWASSSMAPESVVDVGLGVTGASTIAVTRLEGKERSPHFLPVPLPLPFLFGGGLAHEQFTLRTPVAPQCSQSCRLSLGHGSVHPAGLRLKLRQNSFGLPPPFEPPRGPRFLRHPALPPPASSSCGASSNTWCAGNGFEHLLPLALLS